MWLFFVRCIKSILRVVAMMRKVKKLEAEIEELRCEVFSLREQNRNLHIKLVGDEEYRKSLKKETLCNQNKYIVEVQKNVALADIIVSLRQKLDEAEKCGYCDAE
jgi:hypothetical protein